MTGLIKICKQCDMPLPVSDFYNAVRNADGLKKICKKCASANGKIFRHENRERLKKSRAAGYIKNKKAHAKRGKIWREKNKERKSMMDKKWNEENKDRKKFTGISYRALNKGRWDRSSKNNHLKRKYGITIEDYEETLKRQNGCCAICGTKDPKGPKTAKAFVVDHNHSTNKVRGLLCFNCNTALGLFKEDPSVLLQAIKYLGAHVQDRPQIEEVNPK